MSNQEDNNMMLLKQVKRLKKGISIVSACMNRNENLMKAIASWLKLPIDEIIIVDWSSTEPVLDSLQKAGIQDRRVKVIRVEGESRWVLTYAFNVGLQSVAYDTVYKLDADIMTAENFLESNALAHGELVRGFWKTALDANSHDQMFINGSFGCSTQALRNVGFYNENIRSYGWDDSDLYHRLSEFSGLTTKYLALNSLHHIEQEEAERTCHQDLNPNFLLGIIRPTLYTNALNRMITTLWDTWKACDMQRYQVIASSPIEVLCKRITLDRPIPEWVVQQAKVGAVLYFLKQRSFWLVDKFSDIAVLAQLLAALYDREIAFDNVLSLLLSKPLTDHAEASIVISLQQSCGAPKNSDAASVSLTHDELTKLNILRESIKLPPLFIGSKVKCHKQEVA